MTVALFVLTILMLVYVLGPAPTEALSTSRP